MAFRVSLGSVASILVVAAVAAAAPSLARAATNPSTHSVISHPSSGHNCPKGSFWGRNSTLHRCGNKWCTKYGPYHCIKSQPQPK